MGKGAFVDLQRQLRLKVRESKTEGMLARGPGNVQTEALPHHSVLACCSSANLLEDSRSTWSLTLDLVTSDGRRRGAMKIGRIYNQRPLLVDINFLTAVFPIVLADALDHCLSYMECRSKAETLVSARERAV